MRVKKITNIVDFPSPAHYKNQNCIALESTNDHVLIGSGTFEIKTGYAFELPNFYVALIVPHLENIMIANNIIPFTHQEELIIKCINTSNTHINIHKYDVFAYMYISLNYLINKIDVVEQFDN